jgi:DNA repair protein SbcD/Mre11
MAFEPQRFIHAANVRLDVPVSVQTTEKLTDELRFAFEDATLYAFDEVIEACIRRDVDFLLLSGNIFIEADRSLRARLRCSKGFNRLDEQNIHVFVLPGDTLIRRKRGERFPNCLRT